MGLVSFALKFNHKRLMKQLLDIHKCKSNPNELSRNADISKIWICKLENIFYCDLHM